MTIADATGILTVLTAGGGVLWIVRRLTQVEDRLAMLHVSHLALHASHRALRRAVARLYKCYRLNQMRKKHGEPATGRYNLP